MTMGLATNLTGYLHTFLRLLHVQAQFVITEVFDQHFYRMANLLVSFDLEAGSSQDCGYTADAPHLRPRWFPW